VIPEAAPGEPYFVGHSSTITLIDPDGKVHAIFTTPLEAERIAADFAQIVMSYSKP
jgi:cytochrome oxidase Cu insertion factor (SCO1/SenC/PrrC family)